ncbi:MAG: D-alanyl-D-alanine carboxypeptidase/D-alanyl-D-alanine-endopeptidase [Prevotella sp.]
MKKIKRKTFRRILYTIATSIVTLIVAAICRCSCHGCSHTPEDDSTAQPAMDIPIDTALQSRLHAFAQRPRPGGQLAFQVYDLTADKPVYGLNDTLALPSASCMKLVSGIAGLHLLGTGYHYETSLYLRGRISKATGTLDGDLTFKAGLDPQLMEADLHRFAKAAAQRGIRRIGGRLIVDLAIREPVSSEEHWFPWDLTFSKYGLLFKGGERVTRNLKAALRAQGIALRDSQVVEGRLPAGSRPIYHYRRSINPVVRRMWKNSSNTQATSLLYAIGQRYAPQRTPTEAGTDYLRRFVSQELGISSPQISIHDGCGLCIHNRLSPQALNAALRFGFNDSTIRASLMRNLAIAGREGTLAREMTGPLTRGRIIAKTGTLSHPYGISSLAGFCQTDDGHWMAFTIMDSEMSVLDARVLQRRLCETILKNKPKN